MITFTPPPFIQFLHYQPQKNIFYTSNNIHILSAHSDTVETDSLLKSKLTYVTGTEHQVLTRWIMAKLTVCQKVLMDIIILLEGLRLISSLDQHFLGIE